MDNIYPLVQQNIFMRDLKKNIMCFLVKQVKCIFSPINFVNRGFVKDKKIKLLP